MSEYQDVMDRLNGTKPVVERDPFIGPGRHKLIVISVEPFNDRQLKDGVWVGHGPSAHIVFEVEESTFHSPGSRVVKRWHFFKPAKFPNKPTDADEFANFVCKLQGIAEGQHSAGARAMLKSRAEGGMLEAQPARGARIEAIGREVGKPNAVTGRKFVVVAWNNIPQTGEMISQTRAQLDQRSPFQQLRTTEAQPAPAQQYQQPVQPPQQYAPPQGYGYAPQAPVQPAAQPGVPAGGFLGMIK